MKVNVALLRNRSYGYKICPDFFEGEEDMIRFQFNGSEYSLSFEHGETDSKHYVTEVLYDVEGNKTKRRVELVWPVRCTFARLTCGETEVAIGLAKVNYQDKFCKETGRKQAIEAMLNNLYEQDYFTADYKPDEEFEVDNSRWWDDITKAIWQAYFNRKSEHKERKIRWEVGEKYPSDEFGYIGSEMIFSLSCQGNKFMLLSLNKDYKFSNRGPFESVEAAKAQAQKELKRYANFLIYQD